MTVDVQTPTYLGGGAHHLQQFIPGMAGNGWLTIWVTPDDPEEPVEVEGLEVFQKSPETVLASLYGHVQGEKIRIIGRPDTVRVRIKAECRHVRWHAVLRWENL